MNVKTNHVILFLFFSLFAKSQDMSFKNEFLKKWGNAQKYTISVAKAMPESAYDFRPDEDIRSFAELMVHIGEAQLYTASQGISVKKSNYKGGKNDKQAIIDFVAASYQIIRETVEKMPAEDFEKTTSFWAGKTSIRKILNFTNDHLTHHRGQATVYLRLKGIKPPDYIGW